MKVGKTVLAPLPSALLGLGRVRNFSSHNQGKRGGRIKSIRREEK